MELLRIDELQEGMIIAEDIFGKYDILFLAKGTILTKKHISGIKKLNVSHVYVLVKNISEVKYDHPLPILKVDLKLNKEYNRSLDSFKSMYKTIGLGNKLETEVVQECVLPLINEVLTNNNILGRIRHIEINDEYIYKHSVNVCIISTMIGKWLNYTKDDIEKLAISSMLHDIGKSKIPEKVLNKPGKLDLDEYEIIKKHAQKGYELVKNMKGISFESCLGALQHHERIDGSGYPFGLKGDKIHEFAKIISVADVFDAMTSERVYKPKESPFKVAELIVQNSFGILDPYISNLFLNNISQYYVGNIVKLNSGEIGEIVLLNKQVLTRPLVKVNDRFIDLMTQPEYEIIELIA